MEFNGFKIRQRPSDGYIHATDMCKVGKKDWFAYKTNKITRKFIEELKRSPGILGDPIQSIIKGKNDERGTWIHPRIAINLAQWISPQFAVKVTDWVQKFIEGDETLIVDAVKHREKVKNITSSVSLVDIDNNLNLSESEKQFELIQMHKNNITELQKQLNEKEGILIKKDEQIDRMEKLLMEHNIKFDKLLDFATEQKQIATRTEQKLDIAVSSVVEKGNGKKYDNYLYIFKLKEDKIFNGIRYKYYVSRTKNKLKRNRNGKYLLDDKYEKVICDTKLNHSINSWNIIKDKLEKERKVYGYRNYFFIYENNGISVISEKELEETFNSTITTNKNRIKQ